MAGLENRFHDVGLRMQISSAEHAFLVDLLALSSEPRLDQVLGELFRGPALILSMDASQDFKKLAGVAASQT